MFNDLEFISGIATQEVEGSDLVDESSESNGTQEASSYQGQTLPILQKIIDLSAKIQVIF